MLQRDSGCRGSGFDSRVVVDWPLWWMFRTRIGNNGDDGRHIFIHYTVVRYRLVAVTTDGECLLSTDTVAHPLPLSVFRATCLYLFLNLFGALSSTSTLHRFRLCGMRQKPRLNVCDGSRVYHVLQYCRCARIFSKSIANCSLCSCDLRTSTFNYFCAVSLALDGSKGCCTAIKLAPGARRLV